MKSGRPLTIAAVLLSALALKYLYSRAGADDLGWMLRPTALIASWALDVRFEYERGIGFVSRELGLCIAPACAGVNFLVVLFVTLGLGFVLDVRGLARRCGALLACAFAAYAVTLAANALRIVLSVQVVAWPLAERISFAAAHRGVGVAVYLATLYASYWGAGALVGRKPSSLAGALGLPLVLYVGVTLGLPLLRGAGRRPEFAAHATVVLACSVAFLALAGALYLVRRRPS